ncbi:putative adenylosuccinate synthetase [Leishmania major strain Friedlin]|uniref:Adenylosuccinate synthetase n=1 Tax=Leishmania major TaxID=5664 RepID=PURA_LEIMA|nr:putative adenylosuccinate synthetase [Leishmania major strain Friedlin]Q4QG35.1 RecName: Full=Adenylosuccinate synthetase; Short=AMPSase; Short=AdSS; AltName: Full=IMP--aspartate ligase [Leishmania major]CAG9571093.1 adenylosuccinate_synthetase_-_putative [Leishmania major strain Friedlin]CAJ03014.1 putative adenylosuccinate synthetase [Leishmania major strain Friedlin]|eukprot:XP_001681863.1 putative adenylosuccinate synthetase [Leishmania major strain Friedlin]
MPVRRYGGRYNSSSPGVSNALNPSRTAGWPLSPSPATGSKPASTHHDPVPQEAYYVKDEADARHQQQAPLREPSVEVEVEIIDDEPPRGSQKPLSVAPCTANANNSSGGSKCNAITASRYTFYTNAYQKSVYEALRSLRPLPELQEPRRVKEYAETSLKDSLYRIVEAHDVIMVAGAFFGDEGKGKTVDAVARHPLCTCIARVNSGENAGHTVYDKAGRKFVFNLAPSGLLLPGKRNYIGPECVMDPVSFMEKEVIQLIDAGIDYRDRLFIGNVCIVTPYHKLLDLLGSAANSSTLKGMAPVHGSKVMKRGIRLDHIFNDDETLRKRLEKDMDTYFGLLKVKNLSDADVVRLCREENSDGVVRVPDYVIAFAQAEDKVEFLVKLYRDRVRHNPGFPARCDVTYELHAALLRGEKVLLEGPQSYWLSNARTKFWESTTSADTTAAGLLAASQLNFQKFKSVVLNVHKAPGSSRVGIGACPSSFVPQDYFSAQNIKTLRDLPSATCAHFEAVQRTLFRDGFPHSNDKARHNGIMAPVEYSDETGTYNIGVAMAIASAQHHGECGAVTKKPRVCGFFDCVLHHEVNNIQGPYLTISALDRGDEYDKVGVTIAYVYYSPEGKQVDVNGHVYKNGDIIRAGDPVPSEPALYHCHPIVKLIDGWRDNPIAAAKRRRNAPLPRGVCELLSAIEYFTNCKILSIGNGPNGDDIIYLRQ